MSVPFPIRVSKAEQAVPRGRMGYDLRADRLLLHTVQTAEAFDALLSTGSLIADPARAEQDFADAYEWMLRQMAARLPTHGESALWLWARIRRRDLVDLCRRSRGEVLLTCRVPRDRVLLSHFDDWHLVLMRALCVRSVPGESDEDYQRRWETTRDEFEARLEAAAVKTAPVHDWPKDLRDEIERSWETIFDPSVYGRRAEWQATMHELCVNDVVEAVRLAH
ncbi:DUF3841 domain-containing protein [Kribbella swartbergensis]